MVEPTKEDQIDTNLYSRQIGTFGMETMGKLIKMKVLLVGMRGVGVETAKNLILAGPRQVDIYDPTPVAINDLGSNFYLREEHVGKISRAQGASQQLGELNGNVRVNVLDKLSIEDHANYNVVCYTENLSGFANIAEANDFCHKNNVGFILCETLGLFGYAFLDYGEKHPVNDHDGEPCKSFMVVAISKDEKATVTVHEDTIHSFQEGDHVKFAEVEGMEKINGSQTYEITKVRGPYAFVIDLDTREWPEYSRQGLVENVKVTQFVQYHALKQSYKNPVASSKYGILETPDLSKFGRSDQLHIALRAIHDFHTANGKYPTLADADLVAKTAAALNEEFKKDDSQYAVEELDLDVVKRAASFAGSSIVPQAAFFGGIVAQEIVKYTGKYSPLKQWLHLDIFDSVDWEKEHDRKPMNSRYDDQIAIYGRDVQEKLGKVKTFMVGAGALGCEFMKAFAMMGLGCGGGEVHCTDNDTIEPSNLNRQFLFRQQHINKSKSETAGVAGKEMNKDFNVHTYTSFVSPDTEHFFNDKFWENLDFIVNAVDNIKARLYVDQRCVWYEKPLLESGTLGTKANSQMVVPHKTKCYGDSQDPPEQGIPMCTLRNFPNLIEHCIEWGREKFNALFVERIQDAVNFIDKPQQYLDNLEKNETAAGAVDKLTEVEKIVDLSLNADYATCMQIARDYFDQFFDHDIRNLLGMFPPDQKDSSGNPFWSGPKRCPHPESFNADDEVNFQFVWALSNLVAFNLNIKQERDKEAARKLAAATKPKEYVQKKIIVETPEEMKERQEKNLPPPTVDSGVDDKEVLAKLIESLKGKVSDKIKVEPCEFEKDDETNFHIDYIHATAQVRARNYKITECDFGKTKMIAGRIIPAIATTTAMITGAVATEFYKFVQGMTSLEKFKNSFINLALPMFLFSEPDEIMKAKTEEFNKTMACKIVPIPMGYTIYDKIHVEGSQTIQQLVDHLKEKYNMDINSVNCGTMTLWMSFGKMNKERAPMKPEDIFAKHSEKPIPDGRNYMILEVSGSHASGDDEGEEFLCPPIKYTFR